MALTANQIIFECDPSLCSYAIAFATPDSSSLELSSASNTNVCNADILKEARSLQAPSLVSASRMSSLEATAICLFPHLSSYMVHCCLLVTSYV